MIHRLWAGIRGNKMFWFVIGYLILYIVAFFWLESRETEIHLIESRLDQYIPFCEYFIVPYFLWFPYIAVTLIYFICFCRDRRESWRYIYSYCAGMTIFLLVSYFYPNGHNLRPAAEGSGIWLAIVRFLHCIDTSTNVLPSMHVYITVVNSIALLRQKMLRSYRGFNFMVCICSVLIILSTMFLKQHSVVDVFWALILNVICYLCFYKLKK